MSRAKAAKSIRAAPPVPASSPVPAWQKRMAAWSAGPWVFPVVSVLLLLPCFWRSRIQAGDLGSHVYNAWLAQLVARGQAPGLAVVPQTTNILFDLMLSGFNALFGMAASQRIAVSLSVLAFAWGAFGFVCAVARRRAWSIFPAIAMLAYGWVFHAGFFNFYLSLGLSLAAMALVWDRQPGSPGLLWAAAVALLALAWMAHALPVLWAVALMVYRWVLGRVPPERRPMAALGAIAAMFVARVVLGSVFETRSFPGQITLITGADQLWVFDEKYLWAGLALLALWLIALSRLLRRGGREIVAGAPFHFCLLSAAAIVIFPSWVLIPGYKHALAFIAERLSLPLAVCVCALAAGPDGSEGSARAWQAGALALVALAFFGMLYRDHGVFNNFEDHLEHLVAQLPPGQRVVSAVNTPFLRANPVTHMIDRICAGRCYSYANYEPSTAQFRVRALGPNRFVAATYADSLAMQTGSYVVKPADLPLFIVNLNPQGNLVIQGATAGAPIGSTEVNLP